MLPVANRCQKVPDTKKSPQLRGLRGIYYLNEQARAGRGIIPTQSLLAAYQKRRTPRGRYRRLR
ncbi:hypothetical protein DWV07_14540 [Dickeya zeae]|nr:hypothetical protein DWV07_14540 [Dickeya zeae]